MPEKHDPRTILAREIAALEKRTEAEWQAVANTRPFFAFERDFLAARTRPASKAELARLLQISRQHLNALAKLPGAPADSLDPDAWRQFIAGRIGGKRASDNRLLPVLKVCGGEAPALWFAAWRDTLPELLRQFSEHALTGKEEADIAAKLAAELDLRLAQWIASGTFERWVLEQLENGPTQPASGPDDGGEN